MHYRWCFSPLKQKDEHRNDRKVKGPWHVSRVLITPFTHGVFKEKKLPYLIKHLGGVAATGQTLLPGLQSF